MSKKRSIVDDYFYVNSDTITLATASKDYCFPAWNVQAFQTLDFEAKAEVHGSRDEYLLMRLYQDGTEVAQSFTDEVSGVDTNGIVLYRGQVVGPSGAEFKFCLKSSYSNDYILAKYLQYGYTVYESGDWWTQADYSLQPV